MKLYQHLFIFIILLIGTGLYGQNGKYALVIHGGAGNIRPENLQAEAVTS